MQPSIMPSHEPSETPTEQPIELPTETPTTRPTSKPLVGPIATVEPTDEPSQIPVLSSAAATSDTFSTKSISPSTILALILIPTIIVVVMCLLFVAYRQSKNKRKGIFPSDKVEEATIFYRAISDWNDCEDGDLPLSINDLIQVEEQGEDGWWAGLNLNTNKSGSFPSSCVEPSQKKSVAEEDTSLVKKETPIESSQAISISPDEIYRLIKMKGAPSEFLRSQALLLHESVRPRVGVAVSESSNVKGVRVIGIAGKGSGEKCGLKPGDLITSIDKKIMYRGQDFGSVVNDSKPVSSLLFIIILLLRLFFRASLLI